ncbi:MAG: Ig-like domain-containing protein [Saprospiraceae bacterium]|nr:Ig-like domain-containing protein [Saprospiraceae bacterium]
MYQKPLLYLFSLLVILSSLSSCKRSPKALNDEQLTAFKDHIAAFPGGELSVTKSIQIRLREAIESQDSVYVLPEGVATIQPKTKGEWSVTDKRIITFTPEERFKPNTAYTVQLDLGALKDVPKELSTFTFDFKTLKPDFTVYMDRLENIDGQADKQSLYGYLRTADYMDGEALKKILSAKQQKKNLEVTWLEPEGNTKYPFVVKDVQRKKETDGEVTLEWNGKKVGVENTGETTFPIPSQNTFSVVSVELENDPEQLVKINFSDPILKNQSFKGLVEIGEVDDHRFVVDGNLLNVYPEERLSGDQHITINAGIKSESGFALKEGYLQNMVFESLKPAIRLLSNGNILPSSTNLKFNFEAVNINAVDLRVIKLYEQNVLDFLQYNNLDGSANLRTVGRPIIYKTISLERVDGNYAGWKAYSIDLAELFAQDKGAIYRIEMGYKPNYSTYTCEAIDGFDPGDEYETWGNVSEAYWDNDAYYDGYFNYGYYNWRERDNPCNAAYYGSNRVVGANVMASDLGLLAKKSANGELVLVTNNLLSSEPVTGASIKVYNYQKEVLKELVTDKNGMARYKEDEVPYFAMATVNGQHAYLRLEDGNALNLSKFDVSGGRTQRGLKGYIYGERGVWRPGDSIYLTFVLNDVENPLPKNHPVVFELSDTEGKVVDQQVTNTGQDGFYSFETKTSPDASTGQWQAKVKVGGASFYKSLAIETIKPNRLKINFDFEDDVIQADSDLSPTIGVKWLHGANAGALRTTVDADIRSIKSPFDRHKGFVFADPATNFDAQEVRVFDGRLDDNGEMKLPVSMELKDRSPGMLRVTYVTKVAENGGGFSIDALSKNYAPYKHFVGIKTPPTKGWGRWLETDKKHPIELITTNASGKPVGNRKLEVEVYKVNWRWWWNNSEDNLSNYINSNSKTPLYSQTITTNSSGKATYQFKVDYPEWGRYLIRVKDPKSGHATGEVVYADWPYWRSAGRAKDPEAATMLNFTLDKEKYNTGDDVQVSFPSSASGRALVTIENGSRVIDAFWVKPSKDRTQVTFKATDEMAPNAFVSITYLQPHRQTENDLPMRLFGVLPLEVENPKSKLQPKISMAEELKPEASYKVKVSEEKGKAMTYTLAVVDEGLLDLTRFKTPNAWSEFFKRQALGVNTWDVYDKVIGAYGGQIDQVFAVGGGDAEEVVGAQKANRFIPVVTYLGPFTLGRNGSKTHEIDMPNYVGSVRVMVVAGNRQAGAYGNAEQAVPVKKPVMVMGALPRKMSPGEQLSLPVSVFAMDKKVKNVKVDVSTNELLNITSTSTQNVAFSQTGEEDIRFNLVAGDTPGIAKVDIVATGAGETSTYSVEVDVVNPNEARSKFTDVELKGNASESLSITAFGSPGTGTIDLQFSILPDMDFNRRLDYLIQYPYGCTEQTTSSAFPQLYLPDIMDLSNSKKAEIQRNLKRAIARLSNMQHSSGGFRYWSSNSSANDWTTSYAGHFLVEAKNKGYILPAGMLSKWKTYQKNAARSWKPNTTSFRSDLAQAYRLYTLALAGEADLAAMNRLRETPRLGNNAKWRLAAAYAVAGQKRTAEQLIRSASDEFKPEDRYYSYGSTLRNQAMALEAAILAGEQRKVNELLETVTRRLSSRDWYSTQTTAISLYAISKFIEANGGSGLDLSYTLNGETINLKTTSVMALRDIDLDGAATLQIKNNKDNVIYVRVHQRGVPPLGQEAAESRGLGLTIDYKGVSGGRLEPDAIQLGDDFIAEITVSNLRDAWVDDVALSYILPSGWEVVNTRFTDGSTAEGGGAEHIDIRDDRVHYFFDLGPESTSGNSDTKTFKLMLNASYPGKFYLPGARVEAMYDNDYYVSKQGKWITVERPE